jgi:hypothetical protein
MKFTPSLNKLSINLDLGSLHLKSKKKGKRFGLPELAGKHKELL